MIAWKSLVKTKIINYEKKDMIPLTKKEEKHHNKQKVFYICNNIVKYN